MRRARDQRLTVLDRPGEVGAANNACERDLRPAVIQRKVTNGYRAMWAAYGEADIRTVVATARLTPGTSAFGTILQTIAAWPLPAPEKVGNYFAGRGVLRENVGRGGNTACGCLAQIWEGLDKPAGQHRFSWNHLCMISEAY